MPSSSFLHSVPSSHSSDSKIVWYIYLLHMFVQLYIELSEVSQLLAQRNISLLAWSPNALPLVLTLVAQIAIVRLLLEVAATILLSPRRTET